MKIEISQPSSLSRSLYNKPELVSSGELDPKTSIFPQDDIIEINFSQSESGVALVPDPPGIPP